MLPEEHEAFFENVDGERDCGTWQGSFRDISQQTLDDTGTPRPICSTALVASVIDSAAFV